MLGTRRNNMSDQPEVSNEQKQEWQERESADDAAIVDAMKGDERFVYSIDVTRRVNGKNAKDVAWDLTSPGYMEAALRIADKYGHLTVDSCVIGGTDTLLTIFVLVRNLNTGVVRPGYVEESRSKKDFHIGPKVLSKAIRNAIKQFIPYSVKSEMIAKFRAMGDAPDEHADVDLMDQCVELAESKISTLQDAFGGIDVFWAGVKAHYKVEAAHKLSIEQWTEILTALQAKDFIGSICNKFEMETIESVNTEFKNESPDESPMDRCIRLVVATEEVINSVFVDTSDFWEGVKDFFNVESAGDVDDAQWGLITDIFTENDDIAKALREKFQEYLKPEASNTGAVPEEKDTALMDRCVELVQENNDVVLQVLRTDQGFWDAVKFCYEVKSADEMNDSDWNILIAMFEESAKADNLVEALEMIFSAYIEGCLENEPQ